MNAQSLMTTAPTTASGYTTLSDARHMMLQHDLRHLPVVDDEGVLVGIISDRDLLRVKGTMKPEHTVARIMSDDVLTIAPDTRLSHIIDLLVDHRVSALPVVEPSGKLVGIISWVDILLAVRRR